MLPRINFTQINSQNLCWSREFFFWSESLASTVRQTWRFHSCKTYKHAFCRRQGCVNRTWSSSMRDEHLFKMKKKKEAESRITVWHCLQENGMMQTRNDDISGENEWDSCVLDGKWDRDANRRRDFVIKQISKVMDEVNHHALKGRWCNWYDNTRWWSPDAHARLKHRWGGAQAYEEDGEEKKKRKKKCGTAQWLVVPAVTWLVGGGVTCSVGRGRGRVPDGPTLLRSSSRARVRRSNCISCSRTDARRDAAFSHCSIHTEREDKALHTHCCIHSGNECMAQTHAFIFLSSISRHRQTHAWIKGTNENVSTGYYTQT